MSQLSLGQFEELLLRANVAPQYLPAHTAPLAERIVALVRYLAQKGEIDQLPGLLDLVSGSAVRGVFAAAIWHVPAVRYGLASIAAGLIVAVSWLWFGTGQRGVSLLIVPDANAVAMIPPQKSRFTVFAAGREILLPPEGVLIGTAHGVPASLRAAYRAQVADGEPTELAIEYNADVEASLVVLYDGRPCRAHAPGASGDMLWLVHFDECK